MKKSIYLSLILFITFTFLTSPIWAQDTTPPELISIDMSPTNVDVSSEPAEIAVTVHLTDSSGVAFWSTTFSSPSGTQSLEFSASPGLVPGSGSITDGFFADTSALPQGSEEGPWTANIVTVTDVLGNTENIDLSAYGIFLIQVGPSLEDLTPPDVMGVEVSPTVADVTSGDAQVTVSAHLTDDLSGVNRAYLYFISPSGNRSTFTYLWNVSGTLLDGIFEGTLTFPQYTEPGVWRPQMCTDYASDPPREYHCMSVWDRVGNSATIDLDAKGITLEVEVISPPEDLTPPDVMGVEVSPTVADVTSGDAQVTVSAHLTDDLSGVNRAYLYFISPSGNRSTFTYLWNVSGTLLDGIFEGTLTFPQYTEPGVWQPQMCTDYASDPPREYHCMSVWDRVGNSATIDLDAKGITLEAEVISPIEDMLPPELQALSFSPTVIDISAGDAQVTVSAHLTDDLSGVNRAYLYFISPSGNRSTFTYLWNVSGTLLDGIFEGTLTFPQYTEPGVWRPQMCTDYTSDPPREYHCMSVWDRVGNSAAIDLDVGGRPLTLGVLSVPPEIVFSLEPFSAENQVGSSHTLTAKISQDGLSVQGAEVTFEIIQGPHQGASDSAFTDANGQVFFSYTGTSAGVDTIIASVDTDVDGEVDAARQATKEWVEPSNQPPEAFCKDVTVPTDSGICTAASALVNDGSSDPDSDPITLDQSPPGPYPLDSTSVTLTVSDDKGLSDSCTGMVTVLDQEPPTLSCPAPLVAECTGPDGAAVSFSASAADNCTENPSVACDHASGSLFPLGSTSVTCTASDGSGNANSCDFTATVEDTTAPVPDVAELPEVRGECSAAIASSPAATDNCAGAVTGTTSDPLSYLEQGTYTVNWVYTDPSGSTTTQTQTVVVEDTTPPELNITADPDTLWPPNHKMKPATITTDASDNCDSDPVCLITEVASNEPENGLGDGDMAPDWQITGDLTVILRSERAGTGTGRVYTITVECTDASGNSTTAEATVTVPHNQ